MSAAAAAFFDSGRDGAGSLTRALGVRVSWPMSRKQSRKSELTNLWRSTKSAAEFINALYERDFVLLRCDCCRFWVVDQERDVRNLATSLDGVSDEQVGARLADHVRILSIAMFIGVQPCPRCASHRYRCVAVRQPNESADAEDDPDDEIPF
jgi:hypothetical protein